MIKTTTTLYTVVDTKSDYAALVYIKGDEEGIISAKFLTYVYEGRSFDILNSLKAVTGEEIGSVMMTKTAFVKKFGRIISREVKLID